MRKRKRKRLGHSEAARQAKICRNRDQIKTNGQTDMKIGRQMDKEI